MNDNHVEEASRLISDGSNIDNSTTHESQESNRSKKEGLRVEYSHHIHFVGSHWSPVFGEGDTVIGYRCGVHGHIVVDHQPEPDDLENPVLFSVPAGDLVPLPLFAWKQLRHVSDEELRALYVAPLEFGQDKKVPLAD
jgi:hypothetical protein